MTIHSSSRTYSLNILQQPSKGMAFEENLLARIGLAPPLILEIQIHDALHSSQDLSEELPFLICQCSLLKEDSSVADMVMSRPTFSNTPLLLPTKAATELPNSSKLPYSSASHPLYTSTTAELLSGSGAESTPAAEASVLRSNRMLYGTLVAAPQTLKSPEGTNKQYLLFPEMSIRTSGRFKLRCQLMRFRLPGSTDSLVNDVLATAETQTVIVVPRQEYMAPETTDLSRHFARQGVPLLLPPGISSD